MRYRTKYQYNRIVCRARSTLFINAKISKIESLLITLYVINGRSLEQLNNLSRRAN